MRELAQARVKELETAPGIGPESAGAAPEHRQAGSGPNPEDNHV
jgi:DNA uptake protein ComE-like DNA-binding protein